MSTVFETALDAIRDVLAAGLQGVNVERARVDAWSAAELPAVEVSRGELDAQPFGSGLLRGELDVSLSLLVLGAEQETVLDALHQRAHDALLAGIGMALPEARRLSFLGTDEPQVEAGDITLSRLRARYRITTLVAERNLARHR